MNRPDNSTTYHSRRLEGILILLVEDEPDIADLLTFILHDERANVIAVDQAEAALILLDTLRPHLLLCNVKLPQRDGDWLVRQVRTHQSPQVQHLPAIAVSSYMRDVAENAMIDAGFDYFLPKPFDSDELVLTILSLTNTLNPSQLA
jgi:CheY-like chemotaxis protein